MNRIEYLNYVFEGQDITNGSTHFARSLKSSSLEIDTFSFEVRSDNTTLTQFVRNTPLTYYHDRNQIGIFYVQKISRISKSAYRFECTSTVGLLDESYHNGGIYTGQTVKEVVESICAPYPAMVKTNIQKIKLYGWLPIATKRENLTQLLFAIGATLKVDYNGVIRIEGLWDGQSAEIGADRMYSGGTVEYATPVTQVIVTEHSYNQTSTETVDLFEGTASAGDKITFDEPCYDLVAEGFQITESGANYAVVTSGSGKLVGKKYVHTTRQTARDIPAKRRDLVNQSDNIVRVENATLVSLVNAGAVADRLVKYYACTERIANKVVAQRESPGDVAAVYHPYGQKLMRGCIESADTTISCSLAANEKILVGYTPPDVGEQEYYDSVEVITESGAWSVPENVTSVRIVLIGGGDGGASGHKGENGENGDGAPTKGGAGGNGGTGGAGGKITQTEISVTPGSVHQITIGAGGRGGVFSGDGNNTGLPGIDTIFDSISSSSGASSQNGITDPVHQITYAAKGEIGIKGGAGGDGGSKKTELYGHEGQNVDIYKGGAGGGRNWALKEPENYGGGGGGGGAALGSNGGDGGRGNVEYISDILGQGPGWLAHCGSGGVGANATVRPNRPSVYGTGGTGGNGGGGGGGVGAAQGKDVWGATGGIGGNGGNGGDGAPGCVLIYYRIYKDNSMKRFCGKGGVKFNDKHERMVIA